MTDPTPTPNLHLQPINANRRTWADLMNTNLRLIDAVVGTFFIVQNLQGAWKNSTAYTAGQAVVDVDTSVVYQCQIAHTSSAIPATFADDRAAHTSYWTVYSSPARSRGVWVSGTSYALNDFVVSGSQYAICIQTNVAGATFAADVAANKWSVLVDLSAVGSAVLPVPGGAADANKFTVLNALGTGYTIVTPSAALGLFGATSIGIAVLQAGSTGVALGAIGAQPAGNYQPLAASLTTLAGFTIGAYADDILVSADAAGLRTIAGLGTSAVLDVGTGASQVVQLTAAAKLPAVDGSLLTSLPVPGSSSATTFLGANVALSNTANFFDGPNTGSIGAAGQKWLISITALMDDPTSAAVLEAAIFDGTNYIVDISESTDSAGAQTCITTSIVVTLAAATTFTLRAKDKQTASGRLLTTGASTGVVNKSTSITAVRLS